LEVGCCASRKCLGGINRATSCSGDVLEWKVEVVAKDDDQATSIWQSRKRAAKVDQRRGVPGMGRRANVGFRAPDNPPPATTQRLAALIGNDAEKPRPQLCPFTPIRSTPPGANAGILDGVLSLDGVQEHPSRQTHCLVEERSQLRLERISFVISMGLDIHCLRAAFE
jgi:hypothetical protein